MSKLIDYTQMEKIYGLKKSTMSKMLMRGDFVSPVKIGKKNYFAVEDIENWIEAQKSKK